MRVAEGQSLIDVILRSGGSVQDLFAVAGDNEVGLTETLAPASTLGISNLTTPVGSVVEVVQSSVTAPKPVLVSAGQDILDITLQQYGSLSALFDFAKAGISITDDLIPGNVLVAETSEGANKGILRALKGQRINTGFKTTDLITKIKIFDFTFDFTFE